MKTMRVAFLIILFFCFALYQPNINAAESADVQQTAENTEKEEPKISFSLMNNDFFRQSIKERNTARITFEEGDYDASAFHAAEAERYARLSDEYIQKKLLQGRAGRELAAARDHILWAKKVEAATYYAKELEQAEAFYDAAVESYKIEDWEMSLENALAVGRALANVAAPPQKGVLPPDMPLTPGQYKVRPWDIFGDCFWNIAQWFYKDCYKWRIIYEANKDKIPEPDNPDLIEVGTIIDIPSISGEIRVGMYDTGRPYEKD